MRIDDLLDAGAPASVNTDNESTWTQTEVREQDRRMRELFPMEGYNTSEQASPDAPKGQTDVSAPPSAATLQPHPSSLTPPTPMYTHTNPLTHTTTPLARRDFNLDMYWSGSLWKVMTSYPQTTIRKIAEALGLTVNDTRNVGRPSFGNPCVERLQTAIGVIVNRLPRTDDALVALAGNPTSLASDLDDLCYTFGHDIWGMDTKRDHLLKPKPGTLYTKDLLYENEQDRKMIRLHLQQWIFVKAFNLSRYKRLSEAKSNAAKASSPKSETAGMKRAGSPAAPESSKRQFNVYNDEMGAATAISAYHHHHHPLAPAPPSPRPTEQRLILLPNHSRVDPAQARMLRRSEITDLLVRRLHNINTHDVDESHLLTLIRSEWTENAAEYERTTGYLYPFLNTVLTAWLSERRSVLNLESALQDTTGNISRAYLVSEINNLRAGHVRLMAMPSGALLDGGPATLAQILVFAFERITGSGGAKVREMWVEGLEGLGRELDGLAGGERVVDLR